ncbi:DUF5683 domain-containing protein [Rubrivirga litoralis]|uniref:DUF5683 domain-containing protein n=1 Tax=Rubrivirga litoralis TaxID=3075598 RepID=A0ABU3BS87_9BACT|nr:DUF5683 domain-containing protein [Rubrivirga sp. F394]MDT0632158.1 DUF5683 domain-containing protein [Rubrivirga sp. F394]
MRTGSRQAGKANGQRAAGHRPARRGRVACGLVALALFAAAGGVEAQVVAPPPVDAPPADSVAADSLPSPRGAVLRAVAVPGWGQVYAGQPLKAPFAAAAVAGAVVYAVSRQRQYRRYERAARYAGCVDEPDRIDFEEKCSPDILESTRDEWEALNEPTFASVKPIRDRARGQRDIAVLVVGVAYAVQALDAYVAAQLAGFDVSEDLSVRLAPERGGLAFRVRL